MTDTTTGVPLQLNLRAAAEKALGEILPPDKRTAVVVGVTTLNGQTVAQAGFATRVGDHWSLSDTFQWGQGTGLSNSLMLLGSW